MDASLLVHMGWWAREPGLDGGNFSPFLFSTGEEIELSLRLLPWLVFPSPAAPESQPEPSAHFEVNEVALTVVCLRASMLARRPDSSSLAVSSAQ